GSLEVAVGTGPDPDATSTHLLGVSRMHALVGAPETVDAATLDAIAERVRSGLAGAPHPEGAPAVAVGGSVRALAEVIANHRSTSVPPSVHPLVISGDVISAITRRIAPLSDSERVDDLGVRESRAGDLPVAGAILGAAMTTLGIDEVVVSDWGLRTGVLID